MAKANNDAFSYTALVYNSGYDVGMFLDTISGSIARLSLVEEAGSGDSRLIFTVRICI